MLPLNVGIFAEYEKRFEQRKKNMAAYAALCQFVESIGDYPDSDDPAVQVLINKLWDEMIDQIEKVRDVSEQ
jgi:hypothetical protein